jgi:hypothetical protein
VKVTGCRFTNNVLPKDPQYKDAYGYGIYSSDASFYALPWCSSHDNPCSNEKKNSFKGLSYGIYLEGINAMPRPVTIHRAEFEECLFGIHNRGQDGVTITECRFSLGKLPDTEITSEQLGVVIENTSMPFTLAKNYFIGVEGNATKFGGIQTTETGEMNNVIKNNIFSDLTHGNTTYGKNGSTTAGMEDRGLFFECNLNEDITFYDFIVDDHPQLSDILRINQRKIITENPLTYEGAGKQFSYAGDGASDFGNNGLDTVNYFYNSDGYHEEPLIYDDLALFEADTNRGCELVPCTVPCLGETEVDNLKDKYFASKSDHKGAIIKYLDELAGGDTSEALLYLEAAAFYRERMDSSAWMVWLHSALDTVSYHADSTRRWLALHDSYSTDVRLALVYYGDSAYHQAYDLLDSVEARRNLLSEQEYDLDRLRFILDLLEGYDLRTLSEALQDSLEEYAETYTGYASTLSRNILTNYGRYYPPEYHLPDTNQSQPKYAIPGHENVHSKPMEFNIFPNPGNGLLMIECSGKSCGSYDIRFADILGRTHGSFSVDFTSNNNAELDLQVNEGFYFCTIWQDGIMIDTKQLLIQYR